LNGPVCVLTAGFRVVVSNSGPSDHTLSVLAHVTKGPNANGFISYANTMLPAGISVTVRYDRDLVHQALDTLNQLEFLTVGRPEYVVVSTGGLTADTSMTLAIGDAGTPTPTLIATACNTAGSQVCKSISVSLLDKVGATYSLEAQIPTGYLVGGGCFRGWVASLVDSVSIPVYVIQRATGVQVTQDFFVGGHQGSDLTLQLDGVTLNQFGPPLSPSWTVSYTRGSCS